MNSATRPGREQPPIESDAYRLRRTATRDAMTIGWVSALAGDREMTASERRFMHIQKDNRGDVFYSDVIYAITHQFFPPKIAVSLWKNILSHKGRISRRLARNIGITVATLDYLSNVTTELTAATLISEAHVSEIANLAMRDGMTGLFNHSSSRELLALNIRDYLRYGGGLSLILLDIDDFKSVNDRKGHQEGDRILVDLATVLIEQTRDSDICCRVGGDEFLVILRKADKNKTLAVADRIREKATRIISNGHRIAISVGIALCDHEVMSSRELLQRADSALYEAKLSGKNQVVLGVPAPSSLGHELYMADSAGPTVAASASNTGGAFSGCWNGPNNKRITSESPTRSTHSNWSAPAQQGTDPMSNADERPANAAEQYAEAHATHYTEGDLIGALRAYGQIIDLHPVSAEADYSRSQIQNIVKLVVPTGELLASQTELAIRHLRRD